MEDGKLNHSSINDFLSELVKENLVEQLSISETL